MLCQNCWLRDSREPVVFFHIPRKLYKWESCVLCYLSTLYQNYFFSNQDNKAQIQYLSKSCTVYAMEPINSDSSLFAENETNGCHDTSMNSTGIWGLWICVYYSLIKIHISILCVKNLLVHKILPDAYLTFWRICLGRKNRLVIL